MRQDNAGPNALLRGQWGSDAVLLIAIGSGAELQLPCAIVSIGDPVELSADGTFSVLGEFQTSMAIVEALPTVRVTGSTSGTQVRLTLPDQTTDTLMTYELEAGVIPPPLEEPVCPM